MKHSSKVVNFAYSSQRFIQARLRFVILSISGSYKLSEQVTIVILLLQYEYEASSRHEISAVDMIMKDIVSIYT